jgi:hypothetical protein
MILYDVLGGDTIAELIESVKPYLGDGFVRRAVSA